MSHHDLEGQVGVLRAEEGERAFPGRAASEAWVTGCLGRDTSLGGEVGTSRWEESLDQMRVLESS